VLTLNVPVRGEEISQEDKGKIRGHDVCCRSTEGVEDEMKTVL
jgi:hypothetical protein